MNKPQITYMWIGIVVIALMALFPPFMDPNTHDFVGYNSFDANYIDDQKIDTIWEGFTGDSSARKVTIDYSRLMLQCGVVLLLMIAFILSAKNRIEPDKEKSLQNLQ
ncbi:hypothetical protein KKB99_06305 [bacterium]|nr:hypothetical protein [bacterium]MBU1025600.1 hypothetical protein [bacterium]